MNKQNEKILNPTVVKWSILYLFFICIFIFGVITFIYKLLSTNEVDFIVLGCVLVTWLVIKITGKDFIKKQLDPEIERLDKIIKDRENESDK